MSKIRICLLAAVLCLVALCLPALAEKEESDHGDPSHLKDWDAYEPRIVTMENGVRVRASGCVLRFQVRAEGYYC